MEKGQTQPTTNSGYKIPSKFGKKTKFALDPEYKRDQGRIYKHIERHPEDRKGFKKTSFGGMQTISQDRLPSQRKKSKKSNKK